MNAIVNLNHFCEIHGPQTIFSTQTIREKSFLSHHSSNNNITNTCCACGSIGSKVIFLTEDKDSSTMFVSSEKSIFGKEHQSSLKVTCLRSLSCEITANNQEGLVYFGDGNSRLNSLCFTFKVKDSLARGFEKLYSIVLVMKDKMFLLNTQPFLSTNIKDVAKQIQESAHKVYDQEQKQFPQRAERLNTGKASNIAPRSLSALTGESNIFAHLHGLFSWILWAGSRYYTEVLTLGTPSVPALIDKSTEDGFAFIQIDKEEFLMKNFPTTTSSGEGSALAFHDSSYNLRALKSLTTISFNQILFCSLVGIQIVIRGQTQRSLEFSKHFKDYLPSALHRFISHSNKYVPTNKCKILSLPADAVIPHNNVCRIEFMNDRILEPTLIKCPVELPAKLPALMIKILHAIDEKMFTNVILDKFIKALVEEWKNKIICLTNQHDEAKLKRTLGIQAQDELLVNYWLSAL